MLSTRVLAVCTLVLMAAWQACTSASGNEVVLKFNLEKGKTYHYAMDIDMENEMQGQKMASDMNFEYDVQITDEKDGVKTLTTTYRRIAMDMNAPGMRMEIDTDEPLKDTAAGAPANPMNMMGRMFHAVKGKSFQMKVNEQGQIVEVTGMDQLAEAMVNSTGADEEMKQSMRQMFASQFSEENIRQSFSQAFNIFPARPVKVGDTWDREMDMKGLMAGNYKTTYTVKEISGNSVVLDMKSAMAIGDMKGSQEGTLRVDARTGLVTEGSMEQKFGGAVNSVSKIKITGTQK